MADRAPDTTTLQSRAAVLGAAVVTTTGLLSGVVAPLSDAALPWRGVAVAGAVMAVAVSRIAQHHPFARLGPANVLTAARTAVLAVLAGVASGPALPPVTWTLVVLATIGAVADTFDGPLARRSGLMSRFGARFDMEVDALLILVLSVLVWRSDHAGAWVLLSGLMRYGFIVAGWLAPWLRAELPPRVRRQAVCVVQIVALIVALAPSVTPPLSTAISALGLVVLAWSFWVDVRWLAR